MKPWKRNLYIIPVAILCMMLSACASEKTETEPPPEATKESSAAAGKSSEEEKKETETETAEEKKETEAEKAEVSDGLPTADDPLTEIISFPGSFSAAEIGYPTTLTPVDGDFQNLLTFNATLQEGTDDKFCNLIFAFLPINGYDEYMQKGAGAAKPCMKHMQDTFMKVLYGEKLIKSISSDFKDGGDHYSMDSFMWLDGSVFEGDPPHPIRGRLQTRYFGPTGFALVTATVAIEPRLHDYCELTDRMLDSCTYTGGWNTSPKAVPTAPAAAAAAAAKPITRSSSGSSGSSGDISQQSDSGDYGTAYYWYDEDGDVWFWDGYDNEFIGYGGDYYIDDDGLCYESNDAGWDTDDYYYYDDYDPWSDPGDMYDYEEYDDYDPYSDPGDYGTPYVWYDEDGDVWSWDGYEDEFIGSGDDYYIEDGQYYENNDYDPYSDPGDYGDYYEDYDGEYYDDEYYEDGYGDYYEEEYYEEDYGDYY